MLLFYSPQERDEYWNFRITAIRDRRFAVPGSSGHEQRLQCEERNKQHSEWSISRHSCAMHTLEELVSASNILSLRNVRS